MNSKKGCFFWAGRGGVEILADQLTLSGLGSADSVHHITTMVPPVELFSLVFWEN